MKKFLLSLIAICTVFFTANISLACDCGCSKAKEAEQIECQKDCCKKCDCGCQNKSDCKWYKKECDKDCCKKCNCGCKNNEDCKCKSEKPKCTKENSLTDEIINSTKAEENTKCNKAKCHKSKCKKQKCKGKKHGCPLSDIIEDNSIDNAE